MGTAPVYDNSDKTIDIHRIDFVSGKTDISLANYFTTIWHPIKKPNSKSLTPLSTQTNPVDDKFLLATKPKESGECSRYFECSRSTLRIIFKLQKEITTWHYDTISMGVDKVSIRLRADV